MDFTRAEKLILAFVCGVVVLSVITSFVSEPFFVSHIVMEDGPVEWLTVLGLLSCAGLALVRFVKGKQDKRQATYLLGLVGTVLLFTFGAGEEISWGQRLFGIESPEFFEQNNGQGETNLHNLVVGEIKINRLVFGKILAVAVCSFAFLLPWMWSQSTKIRDFAAAFAIPVPRLIHSLIYLGLFLVINTIDHSKRGELLEFSGSFMFFLMILEPLNVDVFRGPEAAQLDSMPNTDADEDSSQKRMAA